MDSKELSKGILKVIAVSAGLISLGWFLYNIRSLLSHIVIALAISFIGYPIVNLMEKRLRFHKVIAVITTMLIFIGVFVGVVAMIVPLIKTQGQNLSLLDIQTIENNLQFLYGEVNEFLKSHNISFPDLMGSTMDFINKNISIFFESMISKLGSIGIGIFNVIFISFFFLKDRGLFKRIILALLPDKNKDAIEESMIEIKQLLSRYFIGLCLQISVLLVIYAVTLFIFGVKDATLIALICALFNVIPYLGPIISAVLIAIFTASSFIGQDFQEVILPTTLYVLLGFIIGQIIDNLVSQPLIFSKSVKSHPLEIFFAIVIGGILYGAMGMVSAVPLYTSIKVIAKEFLSDNKIVRSLTKNI